MLFLWGKFFYFLRIFEPTEKFIRMITTIFFDMFTFLFIYIIANIAFATAFFILDGGVNPSDEPGFRKTGRTWLNSAIYVYTNGLGEFDIDEYGNHDSSWVLYVYFLSLTLII